MGGQAEIPVAVDPNEAEAAAQKRIGDEAYAREEYTAALEAYTASLRHDTSDTKVWANRAAAALKLGDYSLAMSDARKARTLKPDNLKVWHLLCPSSCSSPGGPATCTRKCARASPCICMFAPARSSFKHAGKTR